MRSLSFLGKLKHDAYGSQNKIRDRKNPVVTKAVFITAMWTLCLVKIVLRQTTRQIIAKNAISAKIVPNPWTLTCHNHFHSLMASSQFGEGSTQLWECESLVWLEESCSFLVVDVICHTCMCWSLVSIHGSKIPDWNFQKEWYWFWVTAFSCGD